MLLFYKFFTQFYFFAIKIASLFNNKAKLLIIGQKQWKKILQEKVKTNEKYVWIHCASLGEFEQGRPLIEKIKTETPTLKIALTFFSPSGYEIRKNYNLADIICYLPFDSPKNAKDFLKILNPVYAVFIKYEFWYFMLNQLKKNNIPFFLIAGIFRKNQIFFKTYGKFYLNVLKNFSFFFLQDENSKNILNDYGIKNCINCGDTRFDRVISISKEKYENDFFEKYSSQKNVIVCGSTWKEDEKIIIDYINNVDNEYKFIIAPHEIDEKHIKNIETNIKKRHIKMSEIRNQNPDEYKVIIIDNIGLLSKIYRYGKIAYIGGGFGKGIHNTIEAAVYNIPVIFGPNNKKFKEAQDLLKSGFAFSISNYKDFKNALNIIEDNDKLENITCGLQAYFNESLGATCQIFEKINYIQS